MGIITIRAAALIIAIAAGPVFAQTAPQAQQMQQAPVNPAIDMAGFLRVSQRAALHRESRRVSEEEFARMSREPGTIVLDARSKEKYDELHIKQAVNLSFPDIAIESLKKALPDKKARILIYCNNTTSGMPKARFRQSCRALRSISPRTSRYTTTAIGMCMN